MILNSLENSGRYESALPLFKQAFDFLKSAGDISRFDDRIEIDGDKLFSLKVSGQGRGAAKKKIWRFTAMSQKPCR